jgi:hypothetical protein
MMTSSEVIRELKKRLNAGEPLNAILDDLSSQGISNEELHTIVENIINEDHINHAAARDRIVLFRDILSSTTFYVILFILAVIITTVIYFQFRNQILEKRWLTVNESEIFDPIQLSYSQPQPIVQVFDDAQYQLTPVAKYKVGALVASRQYYNDEGKFAPMDFLLIWGDLASPENKEYLQYSQSNRHGYWRSRSDAPFSESYRNSHIANTHMVPANNNILTGLKNVKPPQVVFMEGYLVNVEGRIGKGSMFWKTSLTRSDSYNGACEIFYVNQLRLGNDTYE